MVVLFRFILVVAVVDVGGIRVVLVVSVENLFLVGQQERRWKCLYLDGY
jgi:hypothetical protein